MDIDREQIIEIICDVCKIKLTQLSDRTKDESVVLARSIIANLLYHHCKMSQREIAKLIGLTRSGGYYHVKPNALWLKNNIQYNKRLRDVYQRVIDVLNLPE